MQQFTVDLPTKSYVDHFIKMNFGKPADFSKDPHLNEEFRRCLTKPSNRDKSKYLKETFAWHTCITQVLIREDDFYRHGWELTKTDIISFGKIIERRCKFMARNLITCYSIVMPEKDAILKFQENFGFTEDIWPFEAIKKDFYRNNLENKVNIGAEITKKMENIFLGNLAKYGTISHKLVLCHGNNK